MIQYTISYLMIQYTISYLMIQYIQLVIYDSDLVFNDLVYN